MKILNFIYSLMKLLPVKDKAVFISGQSNSITEDMALIGEELKKDMPRLKTVFLCAKKDEGRNGKRNRRNILKQMRQIATAKVVVFDSDPGVLCRLKHKETVKFIQMGSGIGGIIKADSAHVKRNFFSEVFVTSKALAGNMTRAWNCDRERAVVMPLPQAAAIANEENRNETAIRIYERYPKLRGKKIVVYTPALRRGKDISIDVIKLARVFSPMRYAFILKKAPKMDTPILVDLKKEDGNGINGDLKDYYIVDEDFTTLEMLQVADYVICDYSQDSLYAAAMGKPLFFYNFDYEKYGGDEAFCVDYMNEMPGVISPNPRDISRAIERNQYDLRRVKAFADKYIPQQLSGGECAGKIAGHIAGCIDEKEQETDDIGEVIDSRIAINPDIPVEEKQKKLSRRGIIPQSYFLTTLLILLFLAESMFMMFLALTNLLPLKYLATVVGIIGVIDVIVVWAFSDEKNRPPQRVINSERKLSGIIMVVITLLIINLGSYGLYSTYDTLHKISRNRTMTEKFYVMVAENGSHSTVEDITGENISVIGNETKTYKEAKGKLVTKADVTYTEVPDHVALANTIVSDEGQVYDDIIFVSRTYYDIICEENDVFEKNTKKIYTVEVEIKSNNNPNSLNVTEDPFNVYISGIDIWGNITQVSRSDVNMIMTVNPKTKEILLTSIPRDAYVTLHSYGALDKLTHSGIYGIDETMQTVEDWMGINIDYYLRLNFSMVVGVVDAIGGIDVYSEIPFKSKISEYTYEEGMNHVDGMGALYFARERKAFKEQDGQRVKNQQKVLKAIIDKSTSSTVILTNYTSILDAVENYMQISLTDKDMAALVRMQLNDMSKWKIKTVSVECTGATRTTYSMGRRELYVAIPDETSVEDARKAINSVMYPVKEEKKEQ